MEITDRPKSIIIPHPANVNSAFELLPNEKFNEALVLEKKVNMCDGSLLNESAVFRGILQNNELEKLFAYGDKHISAEELLTLDAFGFPYNQPGRALGRMPIPKPDLRLDYQA